MFRPRTCGRALAAFALLAALAAALLPSTSGRAQAPGQLFPNGGDWEPGPNAAAWFDAEGASSHPAEVLEVLAAQADEARVTAIWLFDSGWSGFFPDGPDSINRLRSVPSRAMLFLMLEFPSGGGALQAAQAPGAGSGALFSNSGGWAEGGNAAVYRGSGGGVSVLSGLVASQADCLELAVAWRFEDGAWASFNPNMPSVLNHLLTLGTTEALFITTSRSTSGDCAQLGGVAQRLFTLFNQDRAARGAPALQVAPALLRSSEDYARFLYDYGMPHRGANDAHRLNGTPHDRAQAAGYDGGGYGEVLVWSTYSPPGRFSDAELAADLMDWWRGSPPHYAIITDPGQSEAGVGCHVAPDSQDPSREFIICVGHFGD